MPKGRGGSPNSSQGITNAIIFVKSMHKGKRYSANQIRNYIIRNQKALLLEGEHIPQKRTIEKIISNNADKINWMIANIKSNSLEQPWSLAACKEYSAYFTPDSIPFIVECINTHLRMQDVLDEGQRNIMGKSKQYEKSDVFTIRLCIWIARLKPLIEYLFPNEISKESHFLYNTIMSLALSYSYAELASEFMGDKSFDSSSIDDALFAGNHEYAHYQGLYENFRCFNIMPTLESVEGVD